MRLQSLVLIFHHQPVERYHLESSLDHLPNRWKCKWQGHQRLPHGQKSHRWLYGKFHFVKVLGNFNVKKRNTIGFPITLMKKNCFWKLDYIFSCSIHVRHPKKMDIISLAHHGLNQTPRAWVFFRYLGGHRIVHRSNVIYPMLMFTNGEIGVFWETR